MKLKKLLIAMFAAVAALVFVACDSPTKAVEKFREGTIAKDAEKVAETIYIAPETLKELAILGVKSEKDFASMLVKDISDDDIADAKASEVISEEVNGDSATVTLKDGKGKEVKIPCIKVDGKWKIDFGKQK